MEQPDFKNLNKLKEWILNIYEKCFVELKKAQELPVAFGESYSAFCNTSGGWILLDAIEDDPTSIISGVGKGNFGYRYRISMK